MNEQQLKRDFERWWSQELNTPRTYGDTLHCSYDEAKIVWFAAHGVEARPSLKRQESYGGEGKLMRHPLIGIGEY